MDDVIAQMRADVAKLDGPARAEPLNRLGQAFLQRYFFNGMRAATAVPDLDGAITALTECAGYLNRGDPMWANVSAVLGAAHSYRANHVMDGKDNEQAIVLFREALESGLLPRARVGRSQLMLGTQYMLRVMAPSAMTEMLMRPLTTKAGPGLAGDLELAEDCFRAGMEQENSEDIREFAEFMIDMAAAYRSVLGVSTDGIDLQAMAGFMPRLLEIQRRYGERAKPGYGGFKIPDLFTLNHDERVDIVDMAPEERPVVVVTDAGATDEEPAVPVAPVVPEPVAVAVSGRSALRKSLRERLSLARVPVWEAAAALLMPAATTPPVDVVDDAVAIASTVTDLPDESPEDDAVDQFLLAVALHLRHRLDSGGDGADLNAGADALLAAARQVPPDHPAAPVIMRSLGAFLDAERPFGGVLERVAAGFAGRIDAVLATVTDADERANLHALRCVCRAAWAVADVSRAVAGVAPGYPWPDPLKAAARLAE